MIAQSYRRGEKRFKRRFVDGFRRRALESRVQIIVKEAAKIDFLERIGLGFRDLFGNGDRRAIGARFPGSAVQR